ncbi:MAG: glycogen/starch/alpha-glucan family phosphorylase, partial [Oscillospiraceae bacterium]|nr:glycogen/starch/alpha-glucan family phosphorylase [Oscillospiraceae bacterium]
QELSQCGDEQIYRVLLQLTQELSQARPAPKKDRKLYYFSAEFLIGKLLSNNLLALGIFEEVSQILAKYGRSLSAIEDAEPEPSLGNGGLGRLAACFLDSIAALGLSGDGVGLNYHYGLFEQKLENNKQSERPNPWIEDESWLIPTGIEFEVAFGFGPVKAKLLDIAVPGAHTDIANRLHLFDVEKPAPAPKAGIDFDKTDLPAQLTSFLYPDDSDEAGRLLRVYQQYFMVSAGAQLVLRELEERGFDPHTISDHVAIQINDTHPSMVIPELVRLLTQRGLTMDEAVEQVKRTCAYTNHTILAEALEKWPMSFIEKAAPQLVPILRELDKRAKAEHSDPKVAIIQGEGAGETVHMAHLDIHYGYSVNGVAALHTEILKNSELKPFADIYPGKFNNKTNGVTLRRWLEVCNPKLAALLDECVGKEWRTDPSRLNKLMDFYNDTSVLDRMLAIKAENKRALADTLRREAGIEMDPQSVFDIQVKRLHEYKRQQMNALYVIRKYLDIKAGKLPERPVTVIFGAKAAPAYVMAKHIIHLILCLRQLIENDPQVRPWLRVVMVENYNVSWAEKLIPACDISEQISLASKEASGTGNMKFMANGAVTLGTRDGANVEIADLVGPDNIYTFGASSNWIIELYEQKARDPKMGYQSEIYYQRPDVKPLVDFLLDPVLTQYGDAADLKALWSDITGKDWFMSLLDVESYISARDRAIHDYGDKPFWARKMLVNTARCGFFSSDRTIEEYNRDIWHLK